MMYVNVNGDKTQLPKASKEYL